MSYPILSVLWIPLWQEPVEMQPLCLLYGRGMCFEDIGVSFNDDGVVDSRVTGSAVFLYSSNISVF